MSLITASTGFVDYFSGGRGKKINKLHTIQSTAIKIDVYVESVKEKIESNIKKGDRQMDFTFQGEAQKTVGELPAVGAAAPAFELVKTDLSTVGNADLKGKKVILNIFPSIDTPVCATSVRSFNEKAAALENTVVLCVSVDLPFAHDRFCGAEGLKDVVPASDFRGNKFGQAYGLTVDGGPLAGLLARAIVILDEEGNVAYTQLVSELTEEPDYASALAAV